MRKQIKLLTNKKGSKLRLTSTLFKVRQDNKLIITLYFAGLVAFIGATAIFFIRISTGQKDTNKTVKPFTVDAVMALGRIEPQRRVIKLTLAPDLGGAKISQLLVKKGVRVVKGQTIALLDNHQRASAAVELARQEVRVAQADLAIVKAETKQGDLNANTLDLKQIKAQLEEEISMNEAEVARLKTQLSKEQAERQATIDRLRVESRNAESKLRNYQQLAQEEVIFESQSSFDRLTADKAQNALLKAQSDYNFTTFTLQKQINQAQAIASQSKDTLQEQIIEAEATSNSVDEVREVDIIKAQAEVDKAIAIFRQAEKDLEFTYVKAPNDGQIIKINAYPGEIVDDDGVVEIAQNSSMIVVAQVHESDIGKIENGQSATFRSVTGAFAGKITGKVSQIDFEIGQQDALNIDPAAEVDSRVSEVEIHLDPQTSDRLAHLTNSKVIVKID
jgi:HlyD family secretion protein